MKSLSDINPTSEKHKYQLFSNFPIKSIAIFGSSSGREQNDKSDLEILVEFNGTKGLRFIDHVNEFENLAGTKVDLVPGNGMKETYYQAINPDLDYV